MTTDEPARDPLERALAVARRRRRVRLAVAVAGGVLAVAAVVAALVAGA
jgi:uncharacterized protein involved in exopolysaccharide biosynthesis